MLEMDTKVSIMICLRDTIFACWLQGQNECNQRLSFLSKDLWKNIEIRVMKNIPLCRHHVMKLTGGDTIFDLCMCI